METNRQTNKQSGDVSAEELILRARRLNERLKNQDRARLFAREDMSLWVDGMVVAINWAYWLRSRKGFGHA